MTYRHLFIIATFILLSISASAQQQGSADQENSKQRQEQIATELGMSDSQKTQFMQANETLKKETQAVRNNGSLNGDQKQTEVRKLRQAHEQNIKSILTPEQYVKWSELGKKGGQGQGQGQGKVQGQGKKLEKGQGQGKGQEKGKPKN